MHALLPREQPSPCYSIILGRSQFFDCVPYLVKSSQTLLVYGLRYTHKSSMLSRMLKSYAEQHASPDWQDSNASRHPDIIELEAIQQLQQLCDSSIAIQDQQLVPRLFDPAPAHNSITALVQHEAQHRKLQAQAERCLNDDELRLLGSLLQEHATVVCLPAADGAEGEELRINYDGFTSAGRKALAHPDISTAAVAPFTQPGLFLRFDRDCAGCISLSMLLHYISLQTSALRLRLQLSVFDEGNNGFLTLPQLHRFLEAVVPTAPMLQSMEPSFMQHYVQIASRKLLLFHGRLSLDIPSRRQRWRQQGGADSSSRSSTDLVIRLSDLVNSPVMAELQELLMLGPGAEQERDLYSNWFSLQSTQRVLATFTAWDVDGNGTLSKSEFSAISQGAMSELFISRVFEEHVAPRRGATWPPPKRQQSGSGSDGGSSSPCSPSRKPSSLPAISGTSPPRSPASKPLAATGSSRQQQQQQGKIAGRWPPPLPPGAACARDEMDLLAFATFVLAWDHRNQAAAIPYFFKIFDINHRGYLTIADLYTFFRDIHALWVNMGEYAELEIYDVLDEIMDMVKPATPGRITKADLEACKMSGTVFSMLSNVDQFYQYNFRENFMHQDGDDTSS